MLPASLLYENYHQSGKAYQTVMHKAFSQFGRIPRVEAESRAPRAWPSAPRRIWLYRIRYKHETHRHRRRTSDGQDHAGKSGPQAEETDTRLQIPRSRTPVSKRLSGYGIYREGRFGGRTVCRRRSNQMPYASEEGPRARHGPIRRRQADPRRIPTGSGDSLLLFVPEATPSEKEKRHRQRHDTQKPTFHRSRATGPAHSQRLPKPAATQRVSRDLAQNVERVTAIPGS